METEKKTMGFFKVLTQKFRKKPKDIESSTTSVTKTSVSKNKLMVAAIDFGTTYSGWAFSFEHEYRSEPTKMFCKIWSTGKHMSSKAPTTVLVKPDGYTLEAFGYDAEDRYIELVEKGEHENYYYFERFKMMLYNYKKLTGNEDLEDSRGRRLSAQRVFTLVIQYMKDDVLQKTSQKLVDVLEEDEIQWVLTVPAIWNARSKQFMRECAVKAGIKSSNLSIALEPETASLYCKHICLQKRNDNSEQGAVLASFEPGSRYMIVDAGGGTIDIVVHHVGVDGSLEEIYAANGGNWGGTMVDKAFFDLLASIFGENVMKIVKVEHLEDLNDLQREFEVQKRNVNPERESDVRLRVPVSLSETWKKLNNDGMLQNIQQEHIVNGSVTFRADKMLIKSELFKQLFGKPVTEIINHLHKVFEDKKTEGTNTIVMVGGFSESPMLLNAVITAFPDKKVVHPNEAGLSVLKGAVIYGHCNKDIKVRISPYTYGYNMYQNYDANIHPKERMIELDGEQMVARAFQPLIHVGDKLIPETASESILLSPVDGEFSIALQIFASLNPKTQFVDEPGCLLIGDFKVDCRDNNGDVGQVYVRPMFGGTEFEVNVVHEATGKISKAIFDFC